MTGSKSNSPSKPREVADPSEFLETYFRNRGIKRNIESTAIADCVRRAEEARERFKRMRAPGAPDPVPRGGNAQSAILTDAEKYSRRLVNNRKSAAATRVYQEVLKNEQAHTLTSVVEELALCERERAVMESETNRLRTVVDSLRANHPIPVSKPAHTVQAPVAVKEQTVVKQSPTPVPVLARSMPMTPSVAGPVIEERPVKMEMTASQEEDIKALPAVESLSEGAEVSRLEKRTRSLRISTDFSRLHMLGSQSSQELPLPTMPSQELPSLPASQDVGNLPPSSQNGPKYGLSASQEFPQFSMGSMGSQEPPNFGSTAASQDLPLPKLSDTPAVQHIPQLPVPSASQDAPSKFLRRAAPASQQSSKQSGTGPKEATGSNLSVGVVSSQQGPLNLRFSMASQEVGEVDEVLFPTQSSQGVDAAVKNFGRA